MRRNHNRIIITRTEEMPTAKVPQPGPRQMERMCDGPKCSNEWYCWVEKEWKEKAIKNGKKNAVTKKKNVLTWLEGWKHKAIVGRKSR